MQVAEKGPEPVYQLVGGRAILIHLQYAAKQAGEGRGKDEIAERVGDEERGGKTEGRRERVQYFV